MWDTIKKILQKQGGTCIIIEDGKPAYVVSSFEEYENLLDARKPAAAKMTPNVSEQGLLERINQEITDWKAAQSEQESAQELAESVSSEEVKIEDLPL
jgi:hypothetical protein